jgi:hypothetical protein
LKSFPLEVNNTSTMSSSNDAVFLRRNNQIQDAIDSQNMKQALQLIEKRMKKGENTQFLKASDPCHCLFRLYYYCDTVSCMGPTNT